ncbi:MULTISPECIES: outer membrane protein [Halocynthiibacter]|uniref:Porin family protein n=1 Tax=Halocynthiibacter halioticoli TaxID=2986804 RepID=A0AAE3J0V1_9RHOB|nr:MULTISPECIES: porin family protein [Halocynthiibacter]MCV6824645.1 porin family protein [Halocynthiibacter halioticoli]MCW4057646.1 porin family protein [Halocynthiibacter sp. SDUM655004]
MKLKMLTAAGLTCLMATGATAQNWAIEGAVGGRFSNEFQYGGSDTESDVGTMYSLGAYYAPDATPGFEFGVDLSGSNADIADSNDKTSTRAAMAVARYTFYQSGDFSAYGGLGLGYIETSYDVSGGANGSDSGLGGQVSIGARYKLQDDLHLFGEYRHQRAFESANFNGTSMSSDSDNILVGIRASF